MEKIKLYIILVSCLLFGGGGWLMAAVPDDYNPENPSEPATIDYCKVIVSADPQEGADVSGSGRYVVNGNSIYISTNARNNENYTYNFLYWSLNGERTSYSQSFFFTPSKGRFEFVAHYEKVDTPYEPENPAEPSTSSVKRKYYLYLTSNIEGACSFSMASGNKVPEQSQQYVAVYPNSDYKFEGWKLNGVLVSTEQYYYFTMPSANTTLEACFSEIPFDPDSPVEPSSQGGEVDNSTRKLINLSIGSTSNSVDKTRIAINEAMTLEYDAGTDANKFISNDADFQIYSLDAQNVKYSVNERPKGDGVIPLGIVIKKAGVVLIRATRLDCSALLVDNDTGKVTDLSVSGCTFESEAGTFDDRFYIKLASIEGIPQIKIDNKTREYGDENPEWTYTVEGAELTGKPILSTVADKLSPVGTYSIVASKGTIEGSFSVIEGVLTINKAPLTITAKSYSIKQGEAMPTFEATYSGFKNNETDAVLTTKPTLTTTATSASAPGTYDIVVSGAEAQNYEIGYVAGTLTVSEADLVTITANNLTMTYGDAVPELTFKSEGATLVGTPSLSCEATSTSAVGTYPITVTKGTVGNYNVSYVAGTLTINKAPLTVKVENATREQGQENPQFIISYSGWKNGENENVLISKPIATTEATINSPVGQYAIVVSGGEAQNYELSYTNGILTVKEASGIMSVSVEHPAVVYDLRGHKVRSKVVTLKGLPKGVYIVNGSKVVIK